MSADKAWWRDANYLAIGTYNEADGSFTELGEAGKVILLKTRSVPNVPEDLSVDIDVDYDDMMLIIDSVIVTHNGGADPNLLMKRLQDSKRESDIESQGYGVPKSWGPRL
jgi:hypothetical protein